MQRKLTTYGISVAVIIAAAVFLTTFVHAALYAPDGTAPVADSQAASMSTARSQTAHAKPVRLVIPTIGVDANVQRTGINYRGAMGVPTNFTDVAWYAQGAIPGDRGTAVIDGHLDNGLGLDGVFKHLGDLKAGDSVSVRTASGETLHFVVTDVSRIPYDDQDTSSIFDPQASRPELKLVTCAGSWVPQDRTYDQRIVVTAELVK